MPLYPPSDVTAGSGPIWLDNVVCQGWERSLDQCQHSTFGSSRCTHSQDVGVCCGESLV